MDALRAGGREAPEDRPAHHGRGGAEGERDEHVGAAHDAAVNEDRCPAFDRSDNLGERDGTRDGAIELPPAMVRHHDPRRAGVDAGHGIIGAEDSLDDHRQPAMSRNQAMVSSEIDCPGPSRR